jgi:hypothetical protein
MALVHFESGTSREDALKDLMLQRPARHLVDPAPIFRLQQPARAQHTYLKALKELRNCLDRLREIESNQQMSVLDVQI